MWFVALSHRPHFPSLPLPLSVCLSLSLDVKRILPSFLQRRPSHRETQQNSLPPMTHSPTLRALLHTTRSPATTAHLTTPRPGSQSSMVCLPLFQSACIAIYLFLCLLQSAWLPFSKSRCTVAALSRHLIVDLSLYPHLPACVSVYLNTLQA